jgi:chromosome segregation ATPase
MAEEISDGQFKAEMLDFKTEMMRFVETTSKKFDGLTADVRTNSFKLDRMETRFDQLETKVDRIDVELKDLKSDVKTLSGQFSDVGIMAINHHKRIRQPRRAGGCPRI